MGTESLVMLVVLALVLFVGSLLERVFSRVRDRAGESAPPCQMEPPTPRQVKPRRKRKAPEPESKAPNPPPALRPTPQPYIPKRRIRSFNPREGIIAMTILGPCRARNSFSAPDRPIVE